MCDRGLSFVQEVFPSYRKHLFDGLNQQLEGCFDLYSGSTPSSFGVENNCEYHKVVKIYRLGALRVFGFLSLMDIYSRKNIVHVADFKFTSLWLGLIISALRIRRVFLHGQGGYKNSTVLAKIVYFVSILMSSGYICYNDFCREELKKWLPKFLWSKIFVVNNTLDRDIRINESRKLSYSERPNVLFIGRVRKKCGILELAEALKPYGICVECVGPIDEAMRAKLTKAGNVILHGACYEYSEVEEIAMKCRVGAYYGDAGLSVVHYMALGLPVVAHGEFKEHMGPEPAYLKDRYNALLFQRNDPRAFSKCVLAFYQSEELFNSMSQNALKTFDELSCPSMSDQFMKIIYGSDK